MKNLVIILTITVLLYAVVRNLKQKQEYAQQYEEFQPPREPLYIVFFQDVSLSAKTNGVESVTPSMFTPFFDAIDRNIELNFGFIASNSTRQLIPLHLRRWELQRPIEPDVQLLKFTEQAKITDLYQTAINKYRTDSLAFYADRRHRVQEFIWQVLDAQKHYSDPAFSCNTDIRTAIAIADKAFNYSKESFKNYLIMCSDGIDSYTPTQLYLKNKATVMLVNAGRFIPNSVDSMTDNYFQSAEQAFSYILNK